MKFDKYLFFIWMDLWDINILRNILKIGNFKNWFFECKDFIVYKLE